MGSNDIDEEFGTNLHIDLGESITLEDLAVMYQMLPPKIRNMVLHQYERLEPLPMPRPQTILFPDFPLFEAIQDWLFEHDKFDRIPIDCAPLTYIRKNVFDHDLILGNFSLTDRFCGRKWVTQLPYTFTDVALAYLGLCQFSAGERLKLDYSKHKDVCRLKPTNYFSHRYQGEIAYIDLSAAYWSILWPTTIDMQYDPDAQEVISEGAIGYIRCDEFAKWKPVRNILNTLYNYREMRVWDREKQRIVRQFPPNPIYRPYNYAYIMDVMNALVTDVKENFTLLQWLTDAAIVPGEQADALMEFLFEEWFMIGRLKARGEGDSNYRDMYSIHAGYGLPHKTTLHYNPQKNGGYSSSLRPANVEGLKQYRRDLIAGNIPILERKKKMRLGGRTGVNLETAVEFEMPKMEKRERTQNERGWLTTELMREAIPMQDDGER